MCWIHFQRFSSEPWSVILFSHTSVTLVTNTFDRVDAMEIEQFLKNWKFMEGCPFSNEVIYFYHNRKNKFSLINKGRDVKTFQMLKLV